MMRLGSASLTGGNNSPGLEERLVKKVFTHERYRFPQVYGTFFPVFVDNNSVAILYEIGLLRRWPGPGSEANRVHRLRPSRLPPLQARRRRGLPR